MESIKSIILLGLFLQTALFSFCQNCPNLSDNILVCKEGALPYYVSCTDNICTKKSLYPNGKIKLKGKCTSTGKAEVWTAFYNDGNIIISEGIVKDGLLYGKWIFNYKNGNIKAEGEFSIGQFELGCAGSGNFKPASIMIGKWTFWNENGSKNIECHFLPNSHREEILNGKYIKWHANGQKKEEGIYFKGMKNGIWTYWHENGQKQREEYYTYKDCGLFEYTWHECPAGTWSYWNKDGSILKTEKYIEGVKTEEVKY